MESSRCPICNLSVPVIQLERHANDHFADDDYARDFELAHRLSLFPSDSPPIAEDSMKCRPSSLDTPETNTSQRNAEITSRGREKYDGKCESLVRSQNKEIFYKVEGSLMTLLRNCLELNSENDISILSGHVDHFQSTMDRGWGCGWRNIQMLSSHLLSQRPEGREVLYGGSRFVPDIASLQRWLEVAWEKGFDTLGSREFDKKIFGQKNWIGTTECAALLRSFGLRARIVDFCSKEFELGSSIPGLNFGIGRAGKKVDKRKITQVYGPMDMFLSDGKLDLSSTVPTGNRSFELSSCSSEKGHQVLTDWVWDYFSDNKVNKSGNSRVVLSEKAPLYFQHDGHSRTIVGIQATRQGNGTHKYNLLIFDPGEKTRALEKSLGANNGWQKLIKRGVHTLKKPQYQLCFVDPGIARGEELEQLKTLHSIRREF